MRADHHRLARALPPGQPRQHVAALLVLDHDGQVGGKELALQLDRPEVGSARAHPFGGKIKAARAEQRRRRIARDPALQRDPRVVGGAHDVVILARGRDHG